MSSVIVFRYRSKWKSALFAYKCPHQREVNRVQHLQPCILALTSRTKVLRPLVFWDRITLNLFIDEINPPFDGIDRRTIVDIIVCSVHRASLTFLEFSSSMSVSEIY